MPHPQPQTNNNYIDDDLNTADSIVPCPGKMITASLCEPAPGNQWYSQWPSPVSSVIWSPYNSPIQGAVFSYHFWTVRMTIDGIDPIPGDVFKIDSTTQMQPHVACQLSGSSPPGVVGPVINTFPGGINPFPSTSDGIWEVLHTSDDFVGATQMLSNIGGWIPSFVIDLPSDVCAKPPQPTHYCTDFNCGEIAGSGMTAVQIVNSGFPVHTNIDDCIACCGGITTPTYTNGSPNPYYQISSTSAYVTWANTNSLPVNSSGTFINYMWEVHGITSCGQVTCGGLANPWPCCDPNQCQPSDIRLKENINKVGVSKSGIPIYTFNYKGGEQLWYGTMAQDLLNLGKEDAVTIMSNGYYGVYYDMIDVDMIPV